MAHCDDKLFQWLLPCLDFFRFASYSNPMLDNITKKGLIILNYLTTEYGYQELNNNDNIIVIPNGCKVITFKRSSFDKAIMIRNRGKAKCMSFLLSIKHYDFTRGDLLLNCITTLLRYNKYSIGFDMLYDVTV